MRVSAGAFVANRTRLFLAVLTLFSVSSGQALGQGVPFLDPGDTILGIDATIEYSRSPGAEGPANAIDSNSSTKYLNFAKEGSGLIVTPSVAGAVESFQITTANDWPGRDPASWVLYGFDGTLNSFAHSTGMHEAWTLIGWGGVALPGDPLVSADQRGVLGPVVDVPTAAGYEHYKMVFPTLKDTTEPHVDSMQFAEIQFYSDDAATAGQEILAPGDPILPVACCDFLNTSSYPDPNERPALVLDNNSGTKYLNFGGELSGFIVTNAEGATPLHSMRLTTANDAEARDPASYELYGTNDEIQSLNNSQGLGEVWVPISTDALSLPSDRNNDETLVTIGSTTPYSSYKLIFPTLKDPMATGLMQIADVQFFAVPEPSTFLLTVILAAAGLVGVRRR